MPCAAPNDREVDKSHAFMTYELGSNSKNCRDYKMSETKEVKYDQNFRKTGLVATEKTLIDASGLSGFLKDQNQITEKNQNKYKAKANNEFGAFYRPIIKFKCGFFGSGYSK